MRSTPLLRMTVLVLGLAFPSSTLAGSFNFFEASAAHGQTAVVAPTTGSQVFDFDYDPESAEGFGFYGFSEVLILPFGDASFEGFTCEAAGCMHRFWAGGEGAGGVLLSGGSFLGEGSGVPGGSLDPAGDLGLLTASFSGEGGIAVMGCTYTGADWSTQECNPFALVATEGWQLPAASPGLPDRPDDFGSPMPPEYQPPPPYTPPPYTPPSNPPPAGGGSQVDPADGHFGCSLCQSIGWTGVPGPPVPEPGAGLLFGIGALVVARALRR